MRKIFEWIGQERCSIGEVCRRLQRDGVPTRTGKSAWDRSVVWLILKNPAYKGTAAFGKTRSGALKPQRLRAQRGRPEQPRRPISRVDTFSEDQIFINVPGLVSEELFGAVEAQLEENRQRRRDRPRGGRYLLQGLVVCKRCGYGCYGKPVSRASAKGKVPYAYYRCTGSDAYRFGGQRLCWNKQLRTDVLDAAVWEDVRHLLSEPERVRAEYERRLQGPETGPEREVKHLNKMIANLKKMISRLIDAYGDGLLEKSEFEPRILAARERLAKLEDECRQRIDEANQEVELRLVIGQLEEFAKRVSQELQEPDWDTRREVVRALVKQVEIDEQEVRIVYRVSPSPFEGGPQQGSLQHCWGRDRSPLWGPFPLVFVAGRSAAIPLLVGLFHRHLQPHLDQLQEGPVTDPPGYRFHQLGVGDAVEISAQIRVDHFGIPAPQQILHALDRVQGASVGPVGVLLRLQVGFEDGFQEQDRRHLHHAIPDRRDTKRSLLAIGLRDVNPTDRLGAIGSAPESFREQFQPSVQPVRLDVLEGLAVYSRSSAVGSAAVVGMTQDIFAVHFVVQRVEPLVGRSFGLGVQRRLQPADLFWGY